MVLVTSAIDMTRDAYWVYRGAHIAPDLRQLEAEMARVDEALKGRTFTIGGDRLSHSDNWKDLKASKEASAESEADFQQRVLKLARDNGWMAFHPYDSRRSEPGWPDLVLIRDEYLLAVELKTDKGKVTADQQKWLAAFGKVEDVDAHVWRPSDWDELSGVLA